MSFHLHLQTPLGALRVEGSARAVTQLRFVKEEPDGDGADGTHDDDDDDDDDDDEGDPLGVADALQRYFAGELDALATLPVAPEGTPFEQRVWRAVRDVAAGTTTSYGALAGALGETSARAVGSANSKNPIALLIPCHRIVGHDGALTGYAWGLQTKRALLVHEGALAPLLPGLGPSDPAR
jgi:O-6-methylguanine DNA methyltransferase